MTISSIVFILLFLGCTGFFAYKVKLILSNIRLGRDVDRSDNKGVRWKTMARVALGQSKMVVRPVSGLLHIVVYAGFIIINIEVLEIEIDGYFAEFNMQLEKADFIISTASAGVILDGIDL